MLLFLSFINTQKAQDFMCNFISMGPWNTVGSPLDNFKLRNDLLREKFAGNFQRKDLVSISLDDQDRNMNFRKIISEVISPCVHTFIKGDRRTGRSEIKICFKFFFT